MEKNEAQAYVHELETNIYLVLSHRQGIKGLMNLYNSLYNCDVDTRRNSTAFVVSKILIKDTQLWWAVIKWHRLCWTVYKKNEMHLWFRKSQKRLKLVSWYLSYCLCWGEKNTVHHANSVIFMVCFCFFHVLDFFLDNYERFLPQK